MLAHAVQVVVDLVTLATAFTLTVGDFVVVVSQAMLVDQTISELSPNDASLPKIVGRKRRKNG